MKDFNVLFLEILASIKELNPEVYNYIVKKNKRKEIKSEAIENIIAIINESNSKKILFVSIGLTNSLIRKSIYLRKQGFSTIILIKNPAGAPIYKTFFDHVFICDSFLTLAYIFSKIEPYLIHVQWTISRSNYLGILARLFCKSKIIFEFHDLPTLYFSKEDAQLLFGKEEAELIFFIEKFAFEKLDGTVLYYSENIFNQIREKYSIKAPSLEFHPYVCDEFIDDKCEKLSKKDGRFHLIYGGHVAHSLMPSTLFGDVQFHELISRVTQQGIFFHLYFKPDYRTILVMKLFSEYIALKIKNPLFSFKRGVPMEKTSREFSKYDFGVMFYLFEKGTRFREHNNNIIPVKFFSYLEAGLPIIVSEELEYVSKLVGDYEIGIVVSQKDIGNLSKIIANSDYNKLSDNVKKAREKFSMKNNIHRLVDFYSQTKANVPKETV